MPDENADKLYGEGEGKAAEEKAAEEAKAAEAKAAEEKAAEEKAAEEKAAAEKKAAEPTAEEKAAAEKKAAEEKASSEKGKAPEKYELKLPEGSQLPEGHVDKIAALAKERGLSNEDAQAMLDRDNTLLAEHAAAQQEQFEGMRNVWFDAAKADPEIGGPEFAKNAELAKRVVDRYGTPELKEGLNVTGFGNHPELVRFLTKVGKSMSEDQLVLPGQQNADQPKDMAEIFYGSTPK